MDIKENIMFFTPSYQGFLDDADNKKISEEIYDIKNNLNNRNYSNVGGWQSEDIDIFDNFFEKTELRSLTKKIIFNVQQVYDLWNIRNPAKLSNMWCNINGYKDFNVSHFHAKSLFSVSYYVKCNENSGDIIFNRPDSLEHYIDKTTSFHTFTHYSYPPLEGMFVIFPSNVPHYVMPNMTNEDRISIAFNFS